MTLRAAITFAGFCLCLQLHAASADSADASSIPLSIERLSWGSLTLYSENDKYFAGTDRRYTNGLKISGLTANLRSFESQQLPTPVRLLAKSLSRFVKRDEVPKIGLSLGQNIYTPEDTETTLPQPLDRPYAAWLYVGVSFHNYRPSINEYGDRRIPRLDILEINLGMVGPWALGRQIQNGFHDLIGVAHAKGWDNQLKNEPGLNIIFERKWRLRTGDLESDWAIEAIPRVGFCLGNVNTLANAGLEIRGGFRLPLDFGTSLIRPTGDSNPLFRSGFNAFVFVAGDARAIARDITLDGNTFRDSPSISREPFVTDTAYGLGFGGRRWQVVYTQAYRTKEFKIQKDGQDFGSLSMSLFF
ncbi:MAG: lipid A deacylase LpxR family protein [Opitutaceae bacterium]|nr:lipid A deacylase LpxR family protein [Opitutaceae bacterium]